jgi:hypothetical protein
MDDVALEQVVQSRAEADGGEGEERRDVAAGTRVRPAILGVRRKGMRWPFQA